MSEIEETITRISKYEEVDRILIIKAVENEESQQNLYQMFFNQNIKDNVDLKKLKKICEFYGQIFSDEDFGKFFYEYGRTILGNLMICLTKADWNSVSLNSTQEATYVTNYYNNLVIMDNHVEQVVEEFIKVGTDKDGYGSFPFNPKYASEIITRYKDLLHLI